MKHPADGLYYFDRDMLNRTPMCPMARRDISRFMGVRAKVPVTLANIERLWRGYSGWVNPVAISWRLFDAGKVRREDLLSTISTPRDLMDLLLLRARREGLIK